jgi:hypothetical protein
MAFGGATRLGGLELGQKGQQMDWGSRPPKMSAARPQPAADNAARRPISRRLPHGRPVKPVNAVKNSSGRV